MILKFGELSIFLKTILFELIQKRAINWISGRQFDHLSDIELYEKNR